MGIPLPSRLEAVILMAPRWMRLVAAMKGERQRVALAVADQLLARAAEYKFGPLPYTERALAGELGVNVHAVKGAIADMEIDGMVEVKRTGSRHAPSLISLCGIALQPGAITPPAMQLAPSDEDGEIRSVDSTTDRSVDSRAGERSYSPSGGAQAGERSVNSQRNRSVPATSQNQGPVRSPKPSTHGRLPHTPLTQAGEPVPSASGSAPSVAPHQRSLPLTSQSAATNQTGPSEAKDEAPQGPGEAGSLSRDPSPARVRLSRMPARAIKAADHLRDRILAQQPGHQLRTRRWNDDDPLRATWADDVRKLVEIDQRPYEEVAKVIAWLFDKQTAECRFVVHSPSALRAKWDRIVAVMGAPPRQAPGQGGPRGRRSDAEEEAAALAMAPRAPTSYRPTAEAPPAPAPLRPGAPQE